MEGCRTRCRSRPALPSAAKRHTRTRSWGASGRRFGQCSWRRRSLPRASHTLPLVLWIATWAVLGICLGARSAVSQARTLKQHGCEEQEATARLTTPSRRRRGLGFFGGREPPTPGCGMRATFVRWTAMGAKAGAGQRAGERNKSARGRG